jgi:hypothetical protein
MNEASKRVLTRTGLYALMFMLGQQSRTKRRNETASLLAIESRKSAHRKPLPVGIRSPSNMPADHLFTLFVRQAARWLNKKLLIAFLPRSAIML